MMRKPTEYEQKLGQFVRNQFGNSTKVVRYGDDDGDRDIFLVTGENVPVDGVTSYGTVGLSLVAQQFLGQEIFVELLGACASATSEFDNLMASCVFESVKNRSPIIYGSCLKNIIDQYKLSSTLRHVTFVSPFLWDDFEMRTVFDKDVHWLVALPISDVELVFLEERRINELENLFESQQIDAFNINRASSI